MSNPRIRNLVLTLCLLATLPSASTAGEKHCRLGRILEMPVAFDGRNATLPGKINGQDAVFQIDSGAFWSTMSEATAARYGLHVVRSEDFELRVRGVGGTSEARLTTVKELTLFGVPIRHVEFVVMANGVSDGSAGLIGQNLLRFAEVEYDFPHGMMRLFRSHECDDANLAYWLKPDETYSKLELNHIDEKNPHLIATAWLNDQKIRVMFDTGADMSLVSLDAAKRAGLTPESPGVTPMGETSGIGRRTSRTWIGTFKTFRIGDEEIHNARLRFGELSLGTDMLLGQDFFLSHRIFIANSQSRLFMSYTGGPVFDLRAERARAAATSLAASGATPAGEPADAAGFAHRASILAARNDYAQALADVSKAIELAPDNVEYRVQRAALQLESKAPQAALEDLDKALAIQPDHLDALLMRAGIRRHEHKASEALADLDHAARIASPTPEQALQLANHYLDLDFPAEALPRLNQWIELHQDDAHLPKVLGSRCRARALLGIELDKALQDCKAALRSRPDDGAMLESRGLVYLRMRQWDKAIADYDVALGHGAEAWSYYGRGVAKIRKGDSAGGQRDLDAAKALDADLSEKAASHGIAPQ